MSRKASLPKSLGRVAALAAALHVLPASGMTFTAIPSEDGVLVVGAGPIIQGDRAKLVVLLDGLPFSKRTLGLMLDSPGGSVIEAERIAQTIQSSRLLVGVFDGGVCASACFLLFAAAPRKPHESPHFH